MTHPHPPRGGGGSGLFGLRAQFQPQPGGQGGFDRTAGIFPQSQPGGQQPPPASAKPRPGIFPPPQPGGPSVRQPPPFMPGGLFKPGPDGPISALPTQPGQPPASAKPRPGIFPPPQPGGPSVRQPSIPGQGGFDLRKGGVGDFMRAQFQPQPGGPPVRQPSVPPPPSILPPAPGGPPVPQPPQDFGNPLSRALNPGQRPRAPRRLERRGGHR